jgi:hypothetical protein
MGSQQRARRPQNSRRASVQRKAGKASVGVRVEAYEAGKLDWVVIPCTN